ncbi:hypothetical protein ASG90_01075 [Nocardioides sp. Soil797]|nr:hypothetical protein ASG90_01075 [Nocardioides sp. Soil797]
MTVLTNSPTSKTARQDGIASCESPRVLLRGSGWERTVNWLDPSCLGSAAFWVEETRRVPPASSLRVGRTVAEEVALCLLGGYGVNEAMSTHAFWAVREAGLLDTGLPPGVESVEAVLKTPMNVEGYARPVRYRFPVQRAARVAAAVAYLSENPVDPSQMSPRGFRTFLTGLNGVGLKTASWVVRNLTRSDDIAIIDIHIRRAGVAAGVFDPHWILPRDYLLFEEAFCAWAAVGEVRTADLDLCVWSTLARMGTTARLIFGVDRLTDLD